MRGGGGVYWGYIRILERKMETTIKGYIRLRVKGIGSFSFFSERTD